MLLWPKAYNAIVHCTVSAHYLEFFCPALHKVLRLLGLYLLPHHLDIYGER